MPIGCSLTWTTKHQTLCPSCLERLHSANIVFCDNLAFCPLCSLAGNRCVRNECLRLFRSALASNHSATYRRLNFFTPSRHPNKPLQLVRRNEPDGWLLNPEYEDYLPAPDDYPVGGGSPV